jgi:hypothetical protein
MAPPKNTRPAGDGKYVENSFSGITNILKPAPGAPSAAPRPGGASSEPSGSGSTPQGGSSGGQSSGGGAAKPS